MAGQAADKGSERGGEDRIEAIRATLEANAAPLAAIAADLRDRDIRRVAMVGCGDSWISGYG